MLKIHSWFGVIGGVLMVIIIGNLLVKGDTTTSLANGAEKFALGMTQALSLKPQ